MRFYSNFIGLPQVNFKEKTQRKSNNNICMRPISAAAFWSFSEQQQNALTQNLTKLKPALVEREQKSAEHKRAEDELLLTPCCDIERLFNMHFVCVISKLGYHIALSEKFSVHTLGE